MKKRYIEPCVYIFTLKAKQQLLGLSNEGGNNTIDAILDPTSSGDGGDDALSKEEWDW